jgi:hypothetical protein
MESSRRLTFHRPLPPVTGAAYSLMWINEKIGG